MKNYKKILIVLFAAVALFFNSCQTPNEPALTVKDVKVNVLVTDQSGYPLPNARVSYLPGENQPMNTLLPLGGGSGLTDNTGMVSSVLDISNAGDLYTFAVNRPSSTYVYVPEYYHDTSVRLSCTDQTIKYSFFRTEAVNCNQYFGTIDTKPISICKNNVLSESVFTPYFLPSCNETMTVEIVGNFNNITGAQLLINKLSAQTVNQATTFTLAPGDQFTVGMLYTAQDEAVPMACATIQVYISTPSNGRYLFADVNFCAESKCEACACPNDITINYPSATSYEKFCLDTPKEVNVSLASVFNSSQNCKMQLRLESGFTNSSLSLLHFNNVDPSTPIILQPGSSLSRMRFEGHFTNPGQYTDQLVFGIQMIDEDNNIIDCTSKLRINIRSEVTSPACQFSPTGSIVYQPFIRIDSTKTFKEGLNITSSSTGAYYLTIVNTDSECPLVIDDLVISGPESRPFVFEETGTKNYGEVTIPANSSVNIWIRFQPDDTDYDRTGARKTLFNALLQVISRNPNCDLPDLNLHGEIILPGQVCNKLVRWGQNSAIHNGIFLTDDGKIETGNYLDKNCAIFIESINLGATPPSAVLKSGGPNLTTNPTNIYVTFKKVGNYPMTEDDLPALAEANEVAIYSTIANSNPWLDNMNVVARDLIVIKYSFTSSTGLSTYYGLFYVTDIRLEPNSANPQHEALHYCIFVGF